MLTFKPHDKVLLCPLLQECAAMKGPSTAAAAASQGAEGYQQGGLVEAWRLLDAARQAASREQHDLGRQLRTSQPAGLLERMHALSRRYSSSQSSVQFEEDEGPAAAISSLESSSPKLGATTEAADPTHNTAPGQAVEPAVTDSDAAGNATDSAVRTLLPGTTAGWCYSQSKPRENAHRERLDVAERFASLLNSFQQQLSGLSAAATPTQVDAAETRPHEAAEGPQAGRAVPVETSSAAHPEGARTPVSSDAAVKSAAATAGRVRSTARRSFWADNSTQTDPPIVDEAVYLQAFPSTPARKGRIVGVLAGLLLVLQVLLQGWRVGVWHAVQGWRPRAAAKGASPNNPMRSLAASGEDCGPAGCFAARTCQPGDLQLLERCSCRRR
jgi:hypothetical protein